MLEGGWFGRIFGHLTASQWIVLAAAVVSLGVNIGAFAVSGPVSSVSYITFIISITLVFLFDKVERYRFENNAMNEISKFSKPELDLRYLGDSPDAVEWFCNNSSGLTAVSNTVFLRTANEELLYTNTQMPKYEDRIKNILKTENCHWRDLATQNQVHVMDSFRRNLSADQVRKHTYRVLNTDTPLFQMLIMRYRERGRPPVVMFGWAFPDGKAANVYLSNGADTVAYFQNYFDKLYATAAPPVHTLVPALPVEQPELPSPTAQTKWSIARSWLGL